MEAMTFTGRLSGQAAGGGGGGESGDATFVYRPGGTAANNVYVSWSALNTALNLRAGRRVIVFDNQFQDISIPAGNWNMADVTWYGTKITEDAARVSITFADNARVPKLRELHRLRLHASNTSPFDDFQANDQIVFYDCEIAGADESFTSVMDFVSLPAFQSAWMELREGSAITGNGYGFAATVHSNQTLNVVADLDSTVATNSFFGEANSNLVLKGAGAGAVSRQQALASGTVTLLDQVRAFPFVVHQPGATILPGYVTLIDITSGPVAITLPAPNDASVSNGGLVIIKIATDGTDDVTLTSVGGALIDGQASATVSPPYGAVTLVATAVGWLTIGRVGGP